MNHEELRILVSAYYDGEATAEEQVLVESHLKECGECRKLLEGLRQVSSTLKKWPEESLSPDIIQKVHRKMMEQSQEGRKMNSIYSKINVSIATVVIVSVIGVYMTQTYFQGGTQGRLRSSSIASGIQQSRIDLARRHQAPADDRSSQIALAEKNKIQFKDDLGKKSQEITGSVAQYEPYYLSSGYDIQRASVPPTGAPVQAGTSADSLVLANAPNESYAAKAVYPTSQPMRSLAMGGFQKQGYEQLGVTTVARGMAEPAYYPQLGPVLYYPQPTAPDGTEQYDTIQENQFLDATQNPLSTLSIDVDTASYSNVRRFLNQNQLPPADAVRIEEMINYFTYDYPQPSWGKPFSITTEVSGCPWNPQHELVLVGIQGKTLQNQQVPPSNLVFLIDVSGSMAQPNKLPLVKQGFKMLAESLRPQDRVSIVVYAGAAGVVLDSASGSDKWNIVSALDRLQAGGSTAGGQGIQLAYQIAQKNFISNGNNRVILATDGDFNVGVSNDNELIRLIEEKRDQGVFLSVLGFGVGNYKDSKMEKLADKGNGNYAYIDTINEAQKVMVTELGSMLFTIAKDVKIQIEFNPNEVRSYRLIGYENRIMAKEDFNDDTKDAGELGAGHTVTALYEVVPAGTFTFEPHRPNVDPLKYQTAKVKNSTDLMTVKLRYKDPQGTVSQLISKEVNRRWMAWGPTSNNFQFASAVAEFGLLLRDSKLKGSASYQDVMNRAQMATGNDPYGYRQEFLGLVQKAQQLDHRNIGYPAYYPPEDGKYLPVPVPMQESNPIQFKGQ